MLFVDPGKHLLAYAVLGRSGLVHGPDRARTLLAMFPDQDSICVERMVSYPRERSDPNDLFHLVFLAGQLEGLREWREFKYPSAREWKGPVPKPVHHRRMKRDWPGIKTDDTDELDAVGMLIKYTDPALISFDDWVFGCIS